MTTLRTTWPAQIAVVLVLLAASMASGATGFLSGNSPLGENAAEAGFRQAAATLSGGTHRGCGDLNRQDAADFFVAPGRLTWQELGAAERQLLNDVLHGRQPHSALGRLSPQQLEAALDYYQATGAAGRGALPSELIRDFNQARVNFLRTGQGQPPAGVYDFAEGWLQRQTPEWLEANRDAVNSLRQAIETMRQRGGGG